MKTLKTILEEFDIPEFHDGECRVSLTGAGKCYCQITDIKELVVSSIKDALEACRPDIEKISEIEHEQWIKWTQTLEKTEKLSADRIKRWKEYQVPYEELTEDVKEYDRKWARKIATQYDENVKEFFGEEVSK